MQIVKIDQEAVDVLAEHYWRRGVIWPPPSRTRIVEFSDDGPAAAHEDAEFERLYGELQVLWDLDDEGAGSEPASAEDAAYAALSAAWGLS